MFRKCVNQNDISMVIGVLLCRNIVVLFRKCLGFFLARLKITRADQLLINGFPPVACHLRALSTTTHSGGFCLAQQPLEKTDDGILWM